MKTVIKEKLTGVVVADDTSFIDCDLSEANLDFKRTGKVEFSDCLGMDQAEFSVDGEPVSYEMFAQAVRAWRPVRLKRPIVAEQQASN